MKKISFILLFLLGGVFPLSVFSSTPQLFVYNWPDYLPKEILKSFEKETRAQIIYTTYDSNEALYSKIRQSDDENSFDVIFPSTYFVSKMREEGLLRPIDKNKLSNFKHLDKALLDQPFDPQNRYSIPYAWGTTGIAINTLFIKRDEIQYWEDLWKKEFKNQVMLTNDIRDVFYLALKTLGYSGNETHPDHIKEAYLKLKTLFETNVKIINSDAPSMPYINGEVIIGMIWNGEAIKAHRKKPEIEYIYPKEGVILWMDNLCIPQNARNPHLAHTFINYLLRPHISKKITEELGYATPNLTARELLPKEIRDNPVSYPTQANLKGAEFQKDLGEAIQLYENYWRMLMHE